MRFEVEVLQVSVGFLNPAVVLLQISAKHIIVTLVGEIIDLELHSPFVYLLALQKGLKATDKSSRHVSLGALKANPSAGRSISPSSGFLLFAR
jgi:hypothetical protein